MFEIIIDLKGTYSDEEAPNLNAGHVWYLSPHISLAAS